MLPYRLLADVESKLCDAFGVIVDENVYGKNAIQRSTFLFDAPNPISLKKKEIAAGGGSLCWWRALRARVSRARMGNEVSGVAIGVAAKQTRYLAALERRRPPDRSPRQPSGRPESNFAKKKSATAAGRTAGGARSARAYREREWVTRSF